MKNKHTHKPCEYCKFLKTENAELKRLFDLQHTRVYEASRHWQKETGQKSTYPDLGQLVAWLMDKAGLKYKNTGLGKSNRRKKHD